ncbi:MAG: phosphoglycerate kinase [Acidobacteriota bacterium]
MSPKRRLRSVRELAVDGRRVFVRVDFNAPLSDGAVSDDTRLRAALPTLQLLLDGGARLVLASHLGRPKGEPDPRYSMAPVATCLAGLLGREVRLLDGPVTGLAEQLASVGDDEVALLENLRFDPGEKKGDADHARALAGLADLYVNDAFGTCHRAHSSVAVVPTHFEAPSAGLLIEKEIDALARVLDEPTRPMAAVLGGAKVSDKLGVLENLVGRVDKLLIGGAMAYTCLRARGEEVGASLVEADWVEKVGALLDGGPELHLPSDHLVVRSIDAPNTAEVVAAGGFAADQLGVDIGPATRAAFAEAVKDCGTILWNGPMGIFETPAYAEGTRAVAEAVAASEAFSVVGGGDSLAALASLELQDAVSHASTGGGAMLESLSGTELPGITPLFQDAKS